MILLVEGLDADVASDAHGNDVGDVLFGGALVYKGFVPSVGFGLLLAMMVWYSIPWRGMGLL